MAELPILEPGRYDPQADSSGEVAAELYGIDLATLKQWCGLGLPQTDEQLFNPFVLCNWLSDGNLALSPSLARRWRMYLRWFEPFVLGMRERRRIRWQRKHGFYLPQPASTVQWFLGAPLQSPQQECHGDQIDGANRQRVGAIAHWLYRAEALPAGYHSVQGQADVTVTSSHSEEQLQPSEHRELCALATDFLAGYRYGYRRHRRDESGALRCTLQPGSCLDAALEFQRYLMLHDRPSTMVGGIIAHSSLMNPHFWLEVATTAGPVPVDITLPAIARMLGAPWREWLAAYVGGCDARRIVISRGTTWLPMVEGGAFSLAIGELLVQDQEQRWFNGWPCIDWVCGECSGGFSHELQRY